jgi:hypothetical protein
MACVSWSFFVLDIELHKLGDRIVLSELVGLLVGFHAISRVRWDVEKFFLDEPVDVDASLTLR